MVMADGRSDFRKRFNKLSNRAETTDHHYKLKRAGNYAARTDSAAGRRSAGKANFV